MTLKDFLELHQGGGASISINQLPYDNEKHRYTRVYFEGEDQEKVIRSDIFEEIADKEVDHFYVIGGGMGYPLELCICVKRMY